MRQSFEPFSNDIWRWLNAIKICAGRTSSDYRNETAGKASSASRRHHPAREAARTALAFLLSPCPIRAGRKAHGSAVKDYRVRGEAKEKTRGEKGESRRWGGNGREPRFCVCAPLLPRKTRPQRRWDLISAWRHGRKRVLLGKGRRGWCVTLNVLAENGESEQ